MTRTKGDISITFEFLHPPAEYGRLPRRKKPPQTFVGGFDYGKGEGYTVYAESEPTGFLDLLARMERAASNVKPKFTAYFEFTKEDISYEQMCLENETLE